MSETDLTFLEKHSSKNFLPKNEDLKQKFVSKLSHINLSSKNLTIIGSLPCRNLTMLYLNNNKISKIENLDCCINLTHLYLHKNEIKKIENLHRMTKLRKLYLNHNRISVVEGLENLENLEELYVEKQTLDGCDSLCFDPRSVIGIRNSLKILNISCNNISHINEVKMLYFLTTLLAKDNLISNLERTADDLALLPHLQHVTLAGNPIAKEAKYKDRIIIKTNMIQTIDGREVFEITKIFLKNLDIERKLVRKTSEGLHIEVPNAFAKTVPSHIQRAVTRSIQRETRSGPDLKAAVSLISYEQQPFELAPKPDLSPSGCVTHTTFTVEDETDELGIGNLYVAWNKLPNEKSRVPLKPFWRKPNQ